MNIEILFENEHLLVINKPSGLVVHSDGKTHEPTVVDWVLENYPNIDGVGENMLVKNRDGQEIEINRPGIVHRLDRDTSGCLVIAKTQTSFEHLKQQFKDRLVKKTYHALVYGWPKESGDIDAPIGRSNKDFRMKQAGSHARGQLRDAYTEYQVLEYYEDPRKKDKQGKYERYALVECRPKTGRTHQIRVHLKHINHPIVADSLYRGKRKELLGLERTALHAHAIELSDMDDQIISVSSELPIDIKEAISNLSVCEKKSEI
jgi:23S rRNA pseudouridine1911/1915/1917 synthase